MGIINLLVDHHWYDRLLVVTIGLLRGIFSGCRKLQSVASM
jgi:hypothetical protein